MKWGFVAVRCEGSCPEIQERLDIACWHLVFAVQKVGHFEFDVIVIRSPVGRTLIGFTWSGWCIWGDVSAVLIAYTACCRVSH